MIGILSQSGNRVAYGVCAWAFSLCLGLCGCSIPKAFVPPGTLPYQDIAATYHSASIKQSSTLDVLRTMQTQQGLLNPKHVGRELINQSDTLVASSGQSKNKQKHWFTLFSFDEQSMTTNRKYFMCLDEKTLVTPSEPQKPLFLPRKTLVFNSQLVVTDLANQDFDSEQARDIALLESIARNLRSDITTFDASTRVSANGNHIMTSIGLYMNTVFQQALRELDRSPYLANNLGHQGLVFDHMILNKGRIQMILQGDILVSRVEMGLPM
ncbi:MAG: hypothetical protein HQ515_04380 [Phycisphaeraceae bacterium]|nr:hypothetical protein [Phycisphaeraceae bacterium]